MAEQMAELNKGDSRKVVYDKLCESTYTSATSISISGNFSDYRYIMLTAEYPKTGSVTAVTGSMIYPADFIKDNPSTQFMGMSDTIQGTNTVHPIIQYVDDTHIKLWINNNTYLKVVAYGIR